MKVIRIEERKVNDMAECAEKMLRYGGKLMECIDELRDGGEMGERDDDDDDDYGDRYEDYGNRGRMRSRGGRRRRY